MSQDNTGIPVALIPPSVFSQMVTGSEQGVVGSSGNLISPYLYMQEVAANPDQHAPELKLLAAAATNAAIAFAGFTVTGVGALLAPFAAMASFIMTPFLGDNRMI
jgi:hypothetical protein